MTDAAPEAPPAESRRADTRRETPDAGRRGRKWLVRGGIVSAVAGLVIVLLATGAFETVSDRDELKRLVDDAGYWGPVLFVALMVIFVPLNVPGLMFVIPATTLFGTVPGVLLSLLGGFTASMIGVVAARSFGRHAFEARMPERVLRIEKRLSARGFWAVVVSRTFTFLFQPVDWMWGLSSLPMRTVAGGTLVGLIPPTLVIALTGGGLLDLIL